MDNNIVQTELVNDEQEHQPEADKKSVKISLRNAIIIVVIVALAVLAYVYKGLFIAATVNGSPISRLAIIQKLEKTSGKSLLNSLITEKLVQNEASAKKIVISDDEISGEIKKIEDQIVAQGGTLDEALGAQSMSRDDLKKQIVFQKEMEALVADKINVSDEEVAQYIEDNKISIPKGQEAATNEQIKNNLRNQKLNKEATTLIDTLKSQAKINYFVKY
ncbi:SurA N-terminal domain-containing protein [Patescibacteria group bacterium]|nr:SurA N-terminal domain-containing protein [Patescibacteria group bacterium]